MPSTTLKRRWTEDAMRGKTPKKQKKFKRQREYHSSSEDEEAEDGTRRPKTFYPVYSDDEPETVQDGKPVKTARVKSAKPAKPVKPTPKHKAKVPAKSALKKTPVKEVEPVEEEAATSDDGEDGEDDAVEFEKDEFTDSESDASEGSSLSETSTNNPRKVKKRNDPEAFATSMSKILGTKLTSQKRSEPILSRSKSAQDTNKSLADHKLTVKAHRSLLADKKASQEKGRVKDVLGLRQEEVSTAEIIAAEKKLRRTAQKGVIKLFNAVRAAQVKAEDAEKEAKKKGVVGMGKREEEIKEMSKQGFLDMISGGGKKKEGSVEA
ncbi:Rrp15p-domain-containing protein [Amniculicola lignicola CBS 123094]|uniref:Rrp15p-domain-containing protein n=1 Tax=Amniculicola lignicola CBS 123094 TaxID=1392246 RepID=A0A6A5W5B2_9PLEO|nr:Rrp15p-domain-containing protein [Amniculicola lignicola CBS 123094]